MTKVNKKFIEAMQKRLDDKSVEYDGKDNSLNYKNLPIVDLVSQIDIDTDNLVALTRLIDLGKTGYLGVAQRFCIDISNRCQMLWERLEEK